MSFGSTKEIDTIISYQVWVIILEVIISMFDLITIDID
ncbi:hypothetical protein X975_19989, partial [Stegodyphus mimosarum]